MLSSNRATMRADPLTRLELISLAELVGPFSYSGLYDVSDTGEVGEVIHISFQTPDPWRDNGEEHAGFLSHALIIDRNGHLHRHNRADRTRARYAVLAETALLPCVGAARRLAARAISALPGAGLLNPERRVGLRVHYALAFRGGVEPALCSFEFRVSERTNERASAGRVLLFAHSDEDEPGQIRLDGPVRQFLFAGAVLCTGDPGLPREATEDDHSWAARVPDLERLIAPDLDALVPGFLEVSL